MIGGKKTRHTHLSAPLLILCLLLTLAPFHATAQKNPTKVYGNEKYAVSAVKSGDFTTALREFLELYKRDSAHTAYNHYIGICYLNSNNDKKKAIPYLEHVVKKPEHDIYAWYDLGRAYQYAYRFDDALNAFQKFIDLLSDDDENFIPATRQIEICNNAKILVKNPVDVTFENLGKEVNSKYPDYNPYVSKDESVIYYTSKRYGNMGNLPDVDGFYTADIYYSGYKYGQWRKAKRFSSPINSTLSEECAGLANDESHLFVFANNLYASNDILILKKRGKSFQRPEPLSSNINGVSSAFISSNKRYLFFSCEMPGGYGGKDIYISKKLPSGDWGTPVNLGPTINTPWHEEYPTLSPTGKYLYFSSLGHNTMGGFDIFRSVWDKKNNSFSKPKNIGYPVNTPEHNKTISFSNSGKYAYLAAWRPEGYGNLDIYRVVFNDFKPAYTFLKGTIFDAKESTFIKTKDVLSDSLKASSEAINTKDSVQKFPEVVIEVFEKGKKIPYGIYRPDSLTGKYVVILHPGTFTFIAKSNGFEQIETEITIPDRDGNTKEHESDIKLVPIINLNKELNIKN